jgi:hypothetical protein
MCLCKNFECLRSIYFLALLNAFQAEEATKKLDSDVGVMRQRVVQLEGTLRLREKDIERLEGLVNVSSVTAIEKSREHQESLR